MSKIVPWLVVGSAVLILAIGGYVSTAVQTKNSKKIETLTVMPTPLAIEYLLATSTIQEEIKENCQENKTEWKGKVISRRGRFHVFFGNYGLCYLDTVTGLMKLYDVDAKGAYLVGFSADEKRLYYETDFYELYGDYTHEDKVEIAKEENLGTHEIDLETGESVLIQAWREEG